MFIIIQASEMVQLINPGPSPSSQKAALCDKVFERLSAYQGDEVASPRPNMSKMQHFTSIEHYCTASIWATLRAIDVPQRVKLETVAHLSVRLGIKYPSEKSVQSLVGFILLVTMGKAECLNMHASAKLCVVHDFKRILKLSASRTPAAATFIQDYPLTPQGCKAAYLEVYTKAFGLEEYIYKRSYM